MPSNRVIEFRIYRFHPGRRDEFARWLDDHLLPLLERHGIEVVAKGPSLHDRDSFLLIRAYPSLASRQDVLDALRGGDEWLGTQEQPFLDMLHTAATAVFPADEHLIETLKESLATEDAETGLAKGAT